MISLTTLTTLFYFTTIKMISLTTLNTLFYFTTIKMISLTTLTKLFYFTTIKIKPLTTLTTLFYLTTYPHYGISRNFSVFINLYVTVISPSGISVESYMLYYLYFATFILQNF